MRSYIFTERERRIIRGFLSGLVDGRDPSIQQIKSRMRSFSTLAEDVRLYLELSRRIGKPVEATSTQPALNLRPVG